MASVDYRFSRLTCSCIPYKKAANDLKSLLRFDRKPMCISALDCASQKTSSQIYSFMSIQAICPSKSALKHNYLRAGEYRIQSCAASSFHSVSAAKLNGNAFFSKKLSVLPAVNAALTKVSDTTPSTLSDIPHGSQYPRYSPPSYFCFRNLVVYTINFIIACSMLPCSSPLFAHPLLPDPLLDGHLPTSEFAQSSLLQDGTPSSTPIAPTLDTPDLPWHLLSVSWNQNEKSGEVVSEEGNCATCLGVVDDTLGACSAAANCVSTFDDRAFFFVPPWEFEGEVSTAKATLREAIVKMGGTVVVDQNRYMRATFSDKDSPTDDVEFSFTNPILDRTVTLRSASRSPETSDRGRNAKRLEKLRAQVRWEQVPILRNRERKLVFIESPWDTFGPEPPPTYSYNQRLESAPNTD